MSPCGLQNSQNKSTKKLYIMEPPKTISIKSNEPKIAGRRLLQWLSKFLMSSFSRKRPFRSINSNSPRIDH